MIFGRLGSIKDYPFWFLVVWEVSKTTDYPPFVKFLSGCSKSKKNTSTLSGNPFSQEIQQYESLHVHQWAPLCRRVEKSCSVVGDAPINRITIWSKKESIRQHICWRVFIMTWYSNKPTNFDQLSFLQKLHCERKADCKSPCIYLVPYYVQSQSFSALTIITAAH